jgi:hypothetical protein
MTEQLIQDRQTVYLCSSSCYYDGIILLPNRRPTLQHIYWTFTWNDVCILLKDDILYESDTQYAMMKQISLILLLQYDYSQFETSTHHFESHLHGTSGSTHHTDNILRRLEYQRRSRSNQLCVLICVIEIA